MTVSNKNNNNTLCIFIYYKNTKVIYLTCSVNSSNCKITHSIRSRVTLKKRDLINSFQIRKGSVIYSKQNY